jgi:hypothetical protein
MRKKATLTLVRSKLYADEVYDVLVWQDGDSTNLGPRNTEELSFRLNEMEFLDSTAEKLIEEARANGKATAQIMWPD